MTDLIAPALIGAVTVGGIKFLGDRSSPALAAVLGAAPIGLLSTLVLKDRSKAQEYLGKYTLFVAFIAAGSTIGWVLARRGTGLFASVGVAFGVIAVAMAVVVITSRRHSR